MPLLTWEVKDGVAVVVLDTPGAPVNVISRAVKDEMYATLTALERDAAVRAVAFFSGKADNFIAGADIEEFVRLKTAAEAEQLSRDGQALLDRVASFSKPLVAGIHGACLGGGLEFALACRYRVATDHPKTQLGLPEIQLGILPAAGGCQRLPRLIGARAALDIILAGRSERAAKAYRLGMVDELVPQPILKDVAIAAARRLAEQGPGPKRRGRGFLGALLDGNPLGRLLVFHLARKQVLAQTKGNYPAPLAALEAVRYGLSHGQPAGMQREALLFGQLAVSDVSRKLVQIFFATRELKDLGVPGARGASARGRRLRFLGCRDRRHRRQSGGRRRPPEGRRSAARRERPRNGARRRARASHEAAHLEVRLRQARGVSVGQRQIHGVRRRRPRDRSGVRGAGRQAAGVA
jgi:3-hydroxyacyl-CoA dehydrogenase/enoyl-CoA hydratase/3-hydroxybutyryl-CoA epimerase